MKHARADYDRIQDPAGLIPDDEPVFLLRGQDKVAPAIVENWAETVSKLGGSQKIVTAAFRQASRMRAWQMQHGGKVPDMPDKEPS